MAELKDEPFEKMVDDKDLTIEAMVMNETISGVVNCNNCEYWGKMNGYIEADDRKNIKFVCPECNSIEFVRNRENM
jgi:Zn finger protein HypA/HybF involved in hydrogenase expression